MKYALVIGLLTILGAIGFTRKGSQTKPRTASDLLSRALEESPALKTPRIASPVSPNSSVSSDNSARLTIKYPHGSRAVQVVARVLDGQPNFSKVLPLPLNAEGVTSVPPGRYIFYVQDRETGLIEKVDNGGAGFEARATNDLVVDLGDLRFKENFLASMNRLKARLATDPEAVKTARRLPDEILVKFKADTSIADISDLNERLDAPVREWMKLSKVYRLEISDSQTLEEAIKRYAASHLVEYAEANLVGRVNIIPDDGNFTNQWGLHNTTDPTADVDAPEAWDIETGNYSVVVAVIDTGMDFNHPEFDGNLWVNRGETPLDHLDNDGNTYTNDVLGWYFATDGTNSPDISPRLVQPGDAEITVNFKGHGTHVAGIIGARGNNGSDSHGNGVAGLAWRVSLMTLKIGLGEAQDSVLASAVAEAVNYAANKRADIINLSLGVPNDIANSATIVSAIEHAYASGCALFASTGNNTNLIKQLPASHPNVLAVGAMDMDKIRFEASNWGPEIDLVAPGRAIYSVFPHSISNDTGFKALSGTSPATPIVSGIAALMISHNPNLKSNPAAIYEILKSTAQDLVYSSGTEVAGLGWDQYTGHGLVNARRALESKVEIQSPTTSPAHFTTVPEIELSGYANVPLLTSIAWTNAATGQSGAASGLTLWRVKVPLTSRTNLITVTATDAVGTIVTDTITVVLCTEAPYCVVALTHDPLPDGNGTFSGFSLPALNNASQVAFRASVNGASNNANGGVFRFSASPGLVQLVRERDLAPDGFSRIDALTLAGYGEVAINDGGAVFFSSSFDTPNGASDDSGVLVHSGNPAGFLEIAREGQSISTGTFGDFAYSLTPAVNSSNQVVFAATTFGPELGSSPKSGIFRAAIASPAITEIAREGWVPPGGNGFFDYFYGQTINNAGQVAFYAHLAGTSHYLADDEGIYRGDGNTLVQIARIGTNSLFGSFHPTESFPFNDHAWVAFRADTRAGIRGIFLTDGAVPVEIVRWGQTILNGADTIYDLFHLVELNNRGQVCFLAALVGYAANAGPAGIYRGEGSRIVQVARRDRAIPGVNGMISSFGNPRFSMNDLGQILFAAGLNTGVRVLFIYDDTLGLVEIARTGTPLLGSTITQLDFNGTQQYDVVPRGQRGLNNEGTVAFQFWLADGRQGIAVWNMPRVGLMDIQISATDVRLSVATLAGRTNVIQVSTNLNMGFTDLDGGWIVGGSGPAITNFIHVGGATNAAVRFYQLRLVQ